MAEYIEREAAIETIKNLYPSMPLVKLNVDKWHEKNKAYMECEIAIERIPAADVRPVVRGKWGHRWICSNMSGYEYACSCSVCGEPTYRMSLLEKMPHYCPNCGADMRPTSMSGANGEGI